MALKAATRAPVRVLLVDDSPLVLTILTRMLARSPEIEVVGTATQGQAALDLIPALRPDVICTDYHMPVMNGLELTRAVMSRFPCPILVVSSAVGPGDTDTVFQLLEAGAVDIFVKPSAGLGADEAAARQFADKIKILAGVVVFRRSFASSPTGPPPSKAPPTAPIRMVAIGASTGGPQALQAVLSPLPVDFSCPILCVQHISEGFLQGLIDWLGTQCQLKITVARPGETPIPGTVYFPQEGTHLTLDDKGRLAASLAPAVGGHRPAVTVTFNAVAERYGKEAAGVLLTGMGDDGAAGMQAIGRAGGLTIAQDEASCVVFGMPRQAIERGGVRYILPPPEIARTLIKIVSGRRN